MYNWPYRLWKKTLFHLILGLIKPNDGVIAHKGESIFSSLENWYKKIGYISQNLYMLDSSIKDNITLNYNDDKIRDDLLQKSLSVSQLETKPRRLVRFLQEHLEEERLPQLRF